MTAGLPKEERLSGKKAVSALLNGGKWGKTPHFRYCLLEGNGLDFNRMMVSVPKRNFKRAVKRNLLKRRIRESYRTRKNLLEEGGRDILFVYTSTEVLGFDTIREEVAGILTKIASPVQ